MKIEELNIEVEDVSEFNDEAEQILTTFCEDLEDKKMWYAVPEDERWWAEEEGIQFLWTNEAAVLIEVEINRLYSIAVKYFGRDNTNINISSAMYKTP